MSAQASSGATPAAAWLVRPALAADVPAAAAAVAELLAELGGEAPSAAALEEATGALVERPELGALLLADAGPGLVGLLAGSWQHAIHVPGLYGLIQDLWVDPARRGDGVGRALVEAFAGLAKERGAARLEVGLPKHSFKGIEATEGFYLGNGFVSLGTRMRKVLS